jgi:molecular chaperone DnaJ
MALLSRSLTARQRELLQQYADDVEGRAPPESGNPPPPADRASEPQSSKNTSERGDSKVDENGTTSFTPPPRPSSPAEDGWASRAWKRIRGLIGS